jgi:phytoene dehydrogenase-like protein
VGLRLETGDLLWDREGEFVSAMDAHATFFGLLGEEYLNDEIRAWFEQVPVLVSPLQVALGVGMPLADAPTATNGILFQPASPIMLYGEVQEQVTAEVYRFDPAAAPPGKALVLVDLYGRYDFWKGLQADPAAYTAEKERVVGEVIAALDIRFPGLAAKVEMVDVATPVTYERYTGNWQGSGQGWIPTQHAFELKEKSAREENWPASRGIPGLEHFYMAGQWLEPFGGLPTAALSGRGLVEMLCQRSGKPFVTCVD